MGGDFDERRRWPPLTIAIIAINVIVFLADMRFPLSQYGALVYGEMTHGHVWQLITFQFLHGSWLHILLNCWGIFVFGPPLETVLGKARFLTLYLASGVVGGAVQILAWVLAKERFPHEVVGASAGLFGLVAAFTSLFPEARMTVLLFFVIPLRMTANRMLTVAAAITVLGLMFPNRVLGANVAHAAHLGGLVSGLIFVRLFMRRFRA
jgi:membrane associated rhomboid family serine protease